jgi:TPR repeat protein
VYSGRWTHSSFFKVGVFMRKQMVWFFGVSFVFLYSNFCFAKSQRLGLVSQKTLMYLKRLCLKRKEPKSCETVGFVYLRGSLLLRDIILANHYFKLACNSGCRLSCFYLGKHLLKGHGVQANVPKAMSRLNRACKMKVGGACFLLGEHYSINNKYLKAEKLYKRSCSLNYAKACLRLSKNLVSHDYTKSTLLLRKACRLRLGKACFLLGGIHYRYITNKKRCISAKHYFRKACQLKFSLACKINTKFRCL